MSELWTQARRVGDLGDFAFWFKSAEAGAACCYHCGDLALDRGKKGSQIGLLASAVLRMAEEGRVHLVQQRVLPPSDPSRWAYYAIKRGRKTS